MKTPLLILSVRLLLFLAILQVQVFSADALPPGELFRLASSSDFIVVGTVTSSRPIGKRLTKKELSELDDLSKTLGGYLYILKLEQPICARTDFQSDVARPQFAGRKIYIFKKRDTRFFQEEYYQEKQRYLIFLSALPEQKRLQSEYLLDNGHIYYEAFDGKKGLISLPLDKLPLLIKLRTFCQAVHTPTVRRKLTGLSHLSRSTDADLRSSADIAIRHFQKNNQ